MNKFLLSRRRKFLGIGILILPLVVLLNFSGCENLQKKFRRQKKKKDIEAANFIPVLQPVDYEAQANSSEEKYRFRYSLVKVWYKDIYASLDSKTSEKKQRNTIKEIVKQIDSMQKLLNDERGTVLGQLKARLMNLDPLFDEPAQLINYSRVRSELHEVEKVLRRKFKLEQVQGSFRANAVNP